MKYKSIILAAGIACSCAASLFFVSSGQYRAATAVVMSLVLIGVARVNIYWAILGLFAYLSVLGEFRRVLLYVQDWSGADPMLMVSPVLLLTLLVVAVTKGDLSVDTLASKVAALLAGIMVLQIFNPIQGPLAVGVGGILFVLIPFLWFWVGKAFGTEDFLRILFFRLVLPFSFVAAAYGFYQTYVGLPWHQEHWIETQGLVTMYIAETVRGFSFYTNSIEHNIYMSMGATLLWVLYLKGYRAALLPLPILVFGIFVVGSRGPIVWLLLMGVLTWAIQGRTFAVWVPRLAVAVVVAVVGLTWTLTQAQTLGDDERIAPFVQHQTSGLTNPGESTAVGHIWMKINGVQRGFTQPLGEGLGRTTLAAERFGGRGGSTEMDFSDMFVSLGVVGGMLYFMLVGIVGYMAVRYWMRTRSLVALCLVGILIIMAGGWLIGNRYFASVFTWFCVGAVDRLYAESQKESEPVPMHMST